MKILYLSNSTIPSYTANSIQVMKMCEAFSKLGHEVTLISRYRNEYLIENIDNVHRYYGVSDNFNVKYLPRKIILIKTIIYQYNVLKKIKPDIVFGRDISSCLFCILIGYKPIIELHSPLKKSRKLLFNLFGNKIKKIVVISDALKSIIVKQIPKSSSKIIVAHDGVNLDAFKRNNTKVLFDFNENKFIAGYIGSLYSGRGIEEIFEMAKELSDITFVLIGGNEKDIQDRKEQIKNNNIKNVKLLGFINPNDIISYYCSFDILLMPYQTRVMVHNADTKKSNKGTAKWMSPIKMFEYLASGVPIISSDLPVLREVLVDEYNCILVSPDNINEWIEAIKKIRNDLVLSKYLVDNALNDIKKYSWNERAKKILE